MSCDLLVFAPHPDDAELCVGATIAAQVRQGARVVVVDATRGEAGSRGDPEARARDARAAAEILGLAERENLGLPDGDLLPRARDELLAALVDALRRHRPGLVLTIAEAVRHPDHLALAEASWAALKTAALHRWRGARGPAIQDLRCLRYEAELPVRPDLLMACTEQDLATKLAAIRCYRSQFTAGDEGPETSISRSDFLPWIEQRGRVWGHYARAPFAEAFIAPEVPVYQDLRNFSRPLPADA